MSVHNNYKKEGTGMDLWGAERLKLGTILRDKVLNQLNIPWVVENGILLGAYRSGKFITHDDDFDIGLFLDTEPAEVVPDLLKKIRNVLPRPYEARYISSYCEKIEVYDPTYGSFILCGPQYNGASFHYVTADLQFYQRYGDVYRLLYYGQVNEVNIPVDVVLPLSSVAVEDEIFQAPFDVEAYLKCIYGSLSPLAKFNPNTGFYEV